MELFEMGRIPSYPFFIYQSLSSNGVFVFAKKISKANKFVWYIKKVDPLRKVVIVTLEINLFIEAQTARKCLEYFWYHIFSWIIFFKIKFFFVTV